MFILQATNLLALVVVIRAQILNFDDNQSDDLCLTCSCSPDKTSVDCSRRGLTDVPQGYSDQVLKLNISSNEISIFPKNLKHFSNLVSLDLSSNQMNSLPSDALSNLTALEFLNLSRNKFEMWLLLNPNDLLLPAVKLKVLDLSYNNFQSMAFLANQELFVSSSLETLILDHCKITTINGRSPLNGLRHIKTLKLNNNPLQRIQNLMSPTLRSLYVSNCLLRSINHNDFSIMPSLIYLKMSYNNHLQSFSVIGNTTIISNSLRYLDVSYCNIMQPSLQGFPNLKKAVMNHNLLRSLSSDEFLHSSQLIYLDLSYNNIGSIKRDTFRGLTQLEYLDLSWNELAYIPEDTLLEMPSLTQFIISRNYLTRVGHLNSLSVKVVDMSSCEINTIGKDSLEGLQSLFEINLSHNLLSYIPDSISSNTLQILNLNYNRISSINNFTFFMLPHLTDLKVIGNRFTSIWNRGYFQSNPYLENLDLSDNMWRCDCTDGNMFDFYEFITLEPSKKEESYNLICNSPSGVIGQTWLEACYSTWNPSQKGPNPDNLIWFIVVMIIGLAFCFILVNAVRKSMKRRLEAIQAERIRQVEEARDRLRQLRIRHEQEALCNTPDPRDLIAPPSYDEALSMPKLNTSSHSLCEAGTGKNRRKRGRRKTKSSSDLLEETERNGDARVVDDLELVETNNENRRTRRQRVRRYGSHDIAELDHSPGARRRRMSEIDTNDVTSVTVEIEPDLERPLRPRNRFNDDEPRESDF